jgi:hypothetical protein
MKNVLRFIACSYNSITNVIIGIKRYNENIVLIGASVFITVVDLYSLLLLIICRLG